MSKPLDERYFVWLYDQVGDSKARNPARTYWRVLKQLFTKEFVWIVPNDDNRIEDGKVLRNEFVEKFRYEVDDNWMKLGCSMLELLIGLSRRLAFECEGEPRDWFWHLMNNIGLDKLNCNDLVALPDYVDSAMEKVIWRTYHSNGRGGLFPLNNPHDDQRGVEIWYQLNAYILEHD